MTLRIEITTIIGSKDRTFSVWEPSSLMGDHTNITSFGDADGWWGRLGTERNVPPEIMAMKSFSDERLAAARAWSEAKYKRAYDLIIAAHPEAAEGTRCRGEITVRAP